MAANAFGQGVTEVWASRRPNERLVSVGEVMNQPQIDQYLWGISGRCSYLDEGENGGGDDRLRRALHMNATLAQLKRCV